MDALLQDLRYGLRALAKSPGFTAVAVLTLALGLGANATIFTWLDAILLRPLPGVTDVERIVNVVGTNETQGFIGTSYPDYRDLRDGTASLAGVLAHDPRPMSLLAGGQPERVWGMLVSANYFEVLGVRALRGRTFRPHEEAPGAPPSVILAHGLWQRRFAGDPAIVGKPVSLNGLPCTVVGVAPPEFRGSIMGLSFDAWVPMGMQERMVPGGSRLEARDHRWLDLLARLRPGASVREARAEIHTIAARLQSEYPASNRGRGLDVFPLSATPVGATRFLAPVLFVLLGAVGFVLLIACANVANLLLVRAAGRRREIAVRLALGASRGRLLRQLLTESLLLACIGGAAGLLVAHWGAELLASFTPPSDFPVGLNPGVDSRALAFALALSVVTGVVFGLAPALRASRPDVVGTLKDEAGTTAGGFRRARLRGGLVVAQVSLSLLLLVGAGLLLRSLENARSFDPGFNPRGILLASFDLFPNGHTPETGRAFLRQLLARASALPGARHVSLARRVPLGMGGSSSSHFTVEGYSPPPQESAWAHKNEVGPDYFRTMEIPLVAGRDFGLQDDSDAPRVGVVNETMARRYWPGREALGGRVRDGADVYTVVGVARDSKTRLLTDPPAPVLYRSALQAYRGDLTLLVRTEGEPSLLAPRIREQVRALDPALPLFGLRTMEDHVRFATFQQRMTGTLLAVLGGLALVLAAVGIYGVLAYAVAQRTREIGVRVALGGRRGDILGLVVRQAMGLTTIGLAIGLAIAVAVMPLMGRLLFGVSPRDLPTLAGVALILGVVALLASSVPARRAMRIDPIVALRYQ